MKKMLLILTAVVATSAIGQVNTREATCDRLFSDERARQACVEMYSFMRTPRREPTDSELTDAVASKLAIDDQEIASAKNKAQSKEQAKQRMASVRSKSAFELKVLSPGQELRDVRAALGIKCEREEDSAISTCLYLTDLSGIEELHTIAQVITGAWVLKFTPSEKLAYITMTFKSVDFPSVRDAMVAKYGRPTVVKINQYQNRFSAKVSGEQHNWVRGDQVLVLNQYDGRKDASGISLTSLKLFAELEKGIAKKATKAAKDL